MDDGEGGFGGGGGARRCAVGVLVGGVALGRFKKRGRFALRGGLNELWLRV